MKKHLLSMSFSSALLLSVALMITLMMNSCSKEDDGPTDELLNGLTFSGNKTLTDLPKSIVYPNDNVELFKEKVLYFISKSYYTENITNENGKVGEGKHINIDLTLKFGPNTCVFEEHGTEVINTEFQRNTQYAYSFKGDVDYVADTGVTVHVKSNGISISYLGGNATWGLKDYKTTLTVWKDEFFEEVKENEINTKKKYNYSRTGDEIIFNSSQRKLIGKLDMEEKTLALYQLDPPLEESLLGTLRFE